MIRYQRTSQDTYLHVHSNCLNMRVSKAVRYTLDRMERTPTGPSECWFLVCPFLVIREEMLSLSPFGFQIDSEWQQW